MNTNCLENRACPKCGQTEHFDVVATSVFRLLDSGTDHHRDVEYGEDSATECPDCGWHGKWGETAVTTEVLPTAVKRRFWVSWLQPTDDYRAVTFPPNEAIIGYWCSGYDGPGEVEIPILCAVVDAADEEAAAEAVRKDWPEWTAWRFIQERSPSYRPGDRFPIDVEWMQKRFNLTSPIQ